VEPKTYADVLTENFRAARARTGLGQEAVAARMRALGFGEWRYQTVGVIENGKRKLSAEEVMALAWVLGTTITTLMRTPEDLIGLRFRSGDVISARSVSLLAHAYNDEAVSWNGAEPEFRPDSGNVRAEIHVLPRLPPQPPVKE
jgi:transcriptional regulator with XRE-family HTH domain